MTVKPAPEKILICLPGSLDALVSAMAPAAAIRRHHPRARIEAFAPEAHVKLLEPSSDFDTVEAEPEIDGLKQIPAYVQRIRRGNYNIVYDLRTSPKAARYVSAARAFAGRWVGPIGLEKSSAPDGHLVTHYGMALREAGLNVNPSALVPDMRWILKLRRTTRTLEPAYFGLGENYVLMIPGLRPGAANPWEVSNWSALARELLANGVGVTVAGSKADAALANEICRNADGARSLAGRTDLLRIAALAAQSRAVFTPLNALSYLAAGAGGPTVVLFGRKDPPSKAAAPRGPGGVISLNPTTTSLVTLEDALQAARVLDAFGGAKTRESA